jgi:AmiR/NasT family two-component response regulator
MGVLTPLRVVIIEDEALLALQLEGQLIDAGHNVVGCAATFDEAVALIAAKNPDLAFVDIELADGPTGVLIAQELSRNSPTVVVFLTANSKRIPNDFAGAAGVIGKPYSQTGLSSAIKFVGMALRTGAPPPPPPGLMLAPGVSDPKDGVIQIVSAK